MSRRFAVSLSLLFGMAAGLALTYASGAFAGRNGSGTYSLPAGNPVVSGTTITSTWANNTMSDMGTELTSSLDRSGRGAMLAPLQCYAGNLAAPGLSFSGDTDTGLYHPGANEFRLVAASTVVEKVTLSGAVFPLTATFTATPSIVATADGGDSIQATTNAGGGKAITGNNLADLGIGVYGVADGAGAVGVLAEATGSLGYGVQGYGGLTGVAGFATGNGAGVFGTSDAGAGVRGIGGAGVPGGSFSGGSNGPGVQAFGTGTGIGLEASAGSASTGSSRTTAMKAVNGDILLAGTLPNSTAVVPAQTLSGISFAKFWANVSCGTGTTVTLNDGLNAQGPTYSTGALHVPFQTSFANTTYSCSVVGARGGTNGATYSVTTKNVAYVEVSRWDTVGGASQGFGGANPTDTVDIVCYGRQ